MVTKQAVKAKEAPDLIEDTIHELEHLDQEAALSAAHKLAEDVDQNYFKLGGTLDMIQRKKWWPAGVTFTQFVEDEFGFKARKAQYLMSIYGGLVDSGLKWSQVGHLGWTKLRYLVEVMTPENAAEWIKLAEANTVLGIQDAVKKAKKGGGEAPKGEEAKSDTSSMTFKLHADQRETVEAALEKAKSEGETSVNAVALEYICLGYLAGSSKAKPAESTGGLKELMKSAGPEEVLSYFDTLFPDYEITVTLPQ